MMFSLKKVQKFPAARAKSDAKGKKTIHFYLAPKKIAQNLTYKNYIPPNLNRLLEILNRILRISSKTSMKIYDFLDFPTIFGRL